MPEKQPLVKLGSFWKVDNRKDNSPILTGSMGDARLVIFPNRYKEDGKNQPDYILYAQNKEKKEDVNRNNIGQQYQQRNPTPTYTQPGNEPPPPSDQDLLPF